MSLLQNYFAKVPEEKRTSSAIAYLASLDSVAEADPEIAKSIVNELRDQRSRLKLIASENYCSLPVQLAMGNLLTDKYSEGYPGHRFYAGCENVDQVEGRAAEFAKNVFRSDHAYVQPHSGIDANLVAFWAILIQQVQSKEIERLGRKSVDELSTAEYEQVRQLLDNQKIMGMGLGSGGHLTHGYRHNISSKIMRSVSYEVDPVSGLLDYSALHAQVQQEKPLILIAGYSSYPRLIDFAKMREIADQAGAILMVDMAHFAGLVAGKALRGVYDPVPYAQIITSTTHKTLRGPRGGFVLCSAQFREAVDKGCPIVLGGPLPHVMAAKALAFKEASSAAFGHYAHQIVDNARALAEGLMREGVRVVTGGTDNHLVVFDVASSFQLNGRQSELLLAEAHVTANRNIIPQDVHGAWYTSGVRLGTAAVTTRGMKPKEMQEIASIIASLLRQAKPGVDGRTGLPSRAKATVPPGALERARQRAAALLQQFPLYPELIID